MQAKIEKKEYISEGTLYTKFSLPEKIDFEAGQFFQLTLPNPQYTDGRGNKRFLGFVNSPTDKKTVETVLRLGPSAFKRSLNESPVGTVVEIGNVGGEMTLPIDTQTPWVVITGGVGIVPHISMFRSIKEKSLPYNVTLVYSNTKQSWAMFMDEIESYAKDNQHFDFIPTMTQDPNWQGEKRRIDKAFLKEKLINPQGSLFYISGTPHFVPAMVNAAMSLGAETENIKFEVFSGY